LSNVAVAIRSMQKDGKIKTAMTVDCDVHHGNGTAAIFGVQSAEPTPGAGAPAVHAGVACPRRVHDLASPGK
jgi:acetoin utilization deacetylase AcuC-like enzyme